MDSNGGRRQQYILGTAPQAPLRPQWSTMVASHSTVPVMVKLLPKPALVISRSSRDLMAASTASTAFPPAFRNFKARREALQEQVRPDRTRVC